MFLIQTKVKGRSTYYMSTRDEIFLMQYHFSSDCKVIPAHDEAFSVPAESLCCVYNHQISFCKNVNLLISDESSLTTSAVWLICLVNMGSVKVPVRFKCSTNYILINIYILRSLTILKDMEMIRNVHAIFLYGCLYFNSDFTFTPTLRPMSRERPHTWCIRMR